MSPKKVAKPRAPSLAEIANARAILAAHEASVTEASSGIVDAGPCELLYCTEQVTYSLPCFGVTIEPGLKLGYCERNGHIGTTLPKEKPRFLLGTVKRVFGDPAFMEIVFDRPPKGAIIGVTCSVAGHQKYCIPVKRTKSGQYVFARPSEQRNAAAGSGTHPTERDANG